MLKIILVYTYTFLLVNRPHEGFNVDLLCYFLKRMHHLAATIRTEELRQTSDMVLNTRYPHVYYTHKGEGWRENHAKH